MTASRLLGRVSPPVAGNDPAEALGRLSDRLDRLMHEVSLGARSQAEWTRLADEADTIGSQLRAVFRGGPPGRAVAATTPTRTLR